MSRVLVAPDPICRSTSRRSRAKLLGAMVLETDPAVKSATAALDNTLHDLLKRRGYASLGAIRSEGEAKGKREGRIEALFALLEARGIAVSADERTKIQETQDNALLSRWILSAATATTAAEVLWPPKKRPSRRRSR